MKIIDPLIDRRVFFKVAATGVAGYFLSPQNMCAQIAYTGPTTILNTARYCIFILCTGAPSQSDTLDLRVGSWTPANFTPNTINGIDWPGGLLPMLGGQLGLNNFSIIRSCQSTALVHNLLQNWNQIARNPTSATDRDRYGNSAFGNACVTARNVVWQDLGTRSARTFPRVCDAEHASNGLWCDPGCPPAAQSDSQQQSRRWCELGSRHPNR